MAIASRILPTGTFLVNNSLDEVSYSLNGTTGAYTYNNGVSTSVNKLNYSQDFTNWNKNVAPNDYTVSADSTAAPDGSTTADLIIKSTGVSSSSVCYKLFTGAISTAYCGSIYLKAGGYSKVQVYFGNTGFNSTNYGGTFDLAAGTTNTILNGSTVTITSVGNGWYRITVTATSDADGGNYVFAITLLDASYIANFTGDGTSGIYLWGAQVELGSAATAYVATGATTSININNFAQRTIASGIEYVSGSFDEVSYSPNGGTGQIGFNGVSTTTNLLTYSQDFSKSTYWGTTNATVFPNYIAAPDGSNTANFLQETVTATALNHNFINNTALGKISGVNLSNPYTFSIFAKAKERTSFQLVCQSWTTFNKYYAYNFTLAGAGSSTFAFNTVGSTIVSATITLIGDGWYRCSLNGVTLNSTDTTVAMITHMISGGSTSYIGDGTSGMYFWGAQIEQSSSLSTYVATGATTSININNFARRVVSTGVEYVSGEFDEYTGNLV